VDETVAQEMLGRLSPRERQVLDEIASGHLNKQIAHDLGISVRTVEAHRAHIRDRVGVRTMAEVIWIASLVTEQGRLLSII
jgi:two-component system response regulator FixJ